jgi:hypothetical protein
MRKTKEDTRSPRRKREKKENNQEERRQQQEKRRIFHLYDVHIDGRS